MKKHLKISLLAILALVVSSCIKVQTIVKVNKDGSGTIEEKILMSKSFVDMMRSFSASFEDSEEAEPFSLFKEEKLQEAASGYGEGVAYESGKELKEDGWEGYTAVYTFSDITKVKLSMDQDEKVDTGMPSMEEEPEEEKEYYYFGFSGGSAPELTIHRKENPNNEEAEDEDGDESEDPGQDNFNEQMLQMIDGMQFDMAVVVDGKITSTNATYAKGSTVTLLSMDFAEMIKNKEAFMELTKEKPETPEEMKAFADKLPGMKIEVGQPVTVKFK